MERKLTYWLLPTEDFRIPLQEIINRLADEFQAPRFAPHITLHSDNAPVDEAITRFSQAVADVKALTLPVTGVRNSAVLTRTLFIEFAVTPRLQGMHDSLLKPAQQAAPQGFYPHLSLLYQTLDEETRRQLCERLILPFDAITFDVMRIVSIPARINRTADVAGWETVYQGRLSGEAVA